MKDVQKKGGFIAGQFSDISDDGRHLANIDDSGSREFVRVYDLTGASLKFSLPTTEREISCVSIANATRRILTGSSKHCLSIWDLDTGLVIGHFSGFDYPIHSFTLSRDGSRVITSSLVTGEQSMRVYDLVESTFLAAFTSEQSWRAAFQVDNSNTVLCKPGFTGLVKFRFLPSEGRQPSVATSVTVHGEEVDWGEMRVRMDDVTSYEEDGDDDTEE